MRKMLLAAGVCLATMGVVASRADADPTHTAEVFVCDGEETTIFTAGRNGWVDGVIKYHAVSFSFEGTFTPTNGDPEPVSETKVWGGGKDLGNPDAITCTAEVSEQTVDGVFEAVIEVIAVPA
jgi:hypothetical protein